MVKTTYKKQQGTRKEVIPKGDAFMPKVSYKQLKKAYKKEQPGKPQIIMRACLLRKEGMGIHKIARTIEQKYSTVRGWLLRMMDVEWTPKKETDFGMILHRLSLIYASPPMMPGTHSAGHTSEKSAASHDCNPGRPPI